MTHEINMPVPVVRRRTAIGAGTARRARAALAEHLPRDDRPLTIDAVLTRGGSATAVGVEALARLR